MNFVGFLQAPKQEDEFLLSHCVLKFSDVNIPAWKCIELALDASIVRNKQETLKNHQNLG
ncbi:MAG TPA: hypothetical protein V6C85_18310 [Allocoleopsis sp.]